MEYSLGRSFFSSNSCMSAYLKSKGGIPRVNAALISTSRGINPVFAKLIIPFAISDSVIGGGSFSGSCLYSFGNTRGFPIAAFRSFPRLFDPTSRLDGGFALGKLYLDFTYVCCHSVFGLCKTL